MLFYFKVIFSDEKKFNLDGPDGNHSYWRDLRKEPQYFSKRNFGGGSLMVWGAFCLHGTLPLAFPSCKMNSSEYINVLQNHLIPFLNDHEADNLVFQQDNAAIHTSKATKQWFSDNDILVLLWPACSPDLNPIENMWAILVKKVYANNKQYNTILELKSAVLKAWQEIDSQLIAKLIQSMKNRIFEVIKNNGGTTKY